MIDLHCHILPGLDDGALGLQDSLAMARQAEADGITAVCATPHIRHDHHVRIDGIAARVRALQEDVSAEGIDVSILPGGELAEGEADRIPDAELRLITLGAGGSWVLVEPAPGPLGDGLRAVVHRLGERGVRAVIAHPERHADDALEPRLTALADAGCLIQWTAEFVADPLMGDLVLTLARRGLVHLLGSDAHSSHAGRPVRLSHGFARLAAVSSPERLGWMAEHAPHAIVRGEEVTPLPP
jgi:protein-tyrosine phosphatase